MNYFKKIVVIFLMMNSANFYCCAQKSSDWTWSLKKEFTATEILENTNRKQIIFCKNDIPLFSQLIFYWNAFRPEKGYFSFHAQVLDEKNKWHDWHTMINWGKDIQKSFFSEGASGTKYCHVRLEMPPKKLAKGVRIKVVAHDGANLSSLRALGINVANLGAFNEEFNLLNQRVNSIENTINHEIQTIESQQQKLKEIERLKKERTEMTQIISRINEQQKNIQIPAPILAQKTKKLILKLDKTYPTQERLLTHN